jgi:hypothetical protein
MIFPSKSGVNPSTCWGGSPETTRMGTKNREINTLKQEICPTTEMWSWLPRTNMEGRINRTTVQSKVFPKTLFANARGTISYRPTHMGLMNWPIRQRMGGCGPPPPQSANCGSSRTCGSPGCGSPPQLGENFKRARTCCQCERASGAWC